MRVEDMGGGGGGDGRGCRYISSESPHGRREVRTVILAMRKEKKS
jgi:hypothetical protein